MSGNTDWTLTYSLPPGVDGEVVAGWMVNHALASGATNAAASPTDDSLVRELADALRRCRDMVGIVPGIAYAEQAHMAVRQANSALAKFDAINGKDGSDA